jgi:formyl-CoA transferase
MEPRSPLADLLVLDLSRVLAGPFATMMLADLGAEVIKVERPGSGDDTRQWGPPWAGGESAYYLAINRNKKSIALDLKTKEGRDVVRDLAQRADVVMENWRPGTMERWGLGFDRLQASNRGLVYCSITGYGQTGPKRERPGYDFIIQAEGGIMSITGPVEGPPMKVGVAIVDLTAGMLATIAILGALHERARSGSGQYIDMALLDAQIAWLANVGSNFLISGQQPERFGNAHPNIVPYEPFPTSDGWLAVAVGNDRQWQKLCDVAGWDDLAADGRFATNPQRVEHRDILVPILQQRFRAYPSEFWQDLLSPGGIPCGPIKAIDEVFADPHVLARQMLLELPHPTAGSIRLAGSPLKLSRTPVRMDHPPPLLGQHTEEVLQEHLGYSAGVIGQLRDKGVI